MSTPWRPGALFMYCAVWLSWTGLSPLSCPSAVIVDTLHPWWGLDTGMGLHLTYKYPHVQGCTTLSSKYKTPQQVEKKTVEERKKRICPAFWPRDPTFYFAQGPISYIARPDPKPFRSVTNTFSVPLDIFSILRSLSVVSPLTSWALCLPALSVPSTCRGPV